MKTLPPTFLKGVNGYLSTPNLVLSIILAAIIGFAIGNAYGQARMKLIVNNLLEKMTAGLKNIAENVKKEDRNE